MPMISQQANRSRRPGGRFVPTLEPLEDRSVPTVTVPQVPGANLILINATGQHDAIRIFDQGGDLPGALVVTGTGLAHPFVSAATVPGRQVVIDVFTGRGSDRVDYFSLGRAS